jgi:hypothetical protein
MGDNNSTIELNYRVQEDLYGCFNCTEHDVITDGDLEQSLICLRFHDLVEPEGICDSHEKAK